MKHIGPYSRALMRGAIGDAIDGRSRESRFLRAYEHSLLEHVGSKPSAVRGLDRQRESVAALERADQDTTMAKRLLKILEKALAIHVADRDRLTKRLARPPR